VDGSKPMWQALWMRDIRVLIDDNKKPRIVRGVVMMMMVVVV